MSFCRWCDVCRGWRCIEVLFSFLSSPSAFLSHFPKVSCHFIYMSNLVISFFYCYWFYFGSFFKKNLISSLDIRLIENWTSWFFSVFFLWDNLILITRVTGLKGWPELTSILSLVSFNIFFLQLNHLTLGWLRIKFYNLLFISFLWGYSYPMNWVTSLTD